MKIKKLTVQDNGQILVLAEDGRQGLFDVRPYLDSPAFRKLENPEDFSSIRNGGYFVEWDCGADLSADTIEARWTVIEKRTGEFQV